MNKSEVLTDHGIVDPRTTRWSTSRKSRGHAFSGPKDLGTRRPEVDARAASEDCRHCFGHGEEETCSKSRYDPFQLNQLCAVMMMPDV